MNPITKILFFLILVLPMLGAVPTYSQEDSAVTLVNGFKEPGLEGNVYLLRDLQAEQKLFVHAKGTSGNLDPFIALARTDLDWPLLRQQFFPDLKQAQGTGDPMKIINQYADDWFLVWDDDGGEGYAAAFEWVVPTSGDYHLLMTGTPFRETFGGYRITVGINAPEVLLGEATARGYIDIRVDTVASPQRKAIDEASGELSSRKPSRVFELEDLRAGDTLYAHVATTVGNLAPVLGLEDFSGKPLRTGNASGKQQTAALEFTLPESGNYRLRVTACCGDDDRTEGSYRLLVGIGAPEVMTGKAEPTGPAPIKQPTEVKVGIKLQQITDVDQKAENFGIVADLRVAWTDRRLAFSPDTCQCRSRLFTVDGFIKFAQEKGIEWPEFNVFNQQGRSWFQSQLLTLYPDGHAVYNERLSATLQAPDFDFRAFPFDEQRFYIRLLNVLPEESFTYVDLPGFSALGDQLGEEEWIVDAFETTIESWDGQSMFSYGFEAHRHLTYYVFRIFLPILIIILVSWVTFFIRDYGKRIDVASANLLLFIAFNFTISNDLPRLGYLTLLATASNDGYHLLNH